MLDNKSWHLKSTPVAASIFLVGIVYLLVSPGREQIDSIPSLYDQKRVTQQIILALSCLTIIFSHQIRESIHLILISAPKYVLNILALIVILSFISIYRSPAPDYALLEVINFMGLAALSLTIAAVSSLYKQLTIKTTIWALIAFATIYELVFLISCITGLILEGKLKILIIFSGFSHIRFFNQYQIWSLPLISLPLLIHPNLPRYLRISVFIIGSLWFTILFASSGRGATLAYIAALLLTAILFRSKSISIIKLNIKCLFTGLASYIILFICIPLLPIFQINKIAIENITSSTSGSSRISLWIKAIDFIQQSPWLGIGPMQYAYYPNKIAAHPHNSLLQIAAEFGLPVAFLSLSLIALFVFKWRRNTLDYASPEGNQGMDNSSTIRVALFFSLMSGLIYSLVSGIIVMPASQNMLAIILGIMIGMYFQSTQKEMTYLKNNNPRYLILILIAGAILIFQTFLLAPQIISKVIYPFRYHYVSTHTKGPRFWEMGGIVQDAVSYNQLYPQNLKH